MREFTPLAIILGVVLGIIMGAANALMGLKYGLAISASIPTAVISLAILRGILRRGTILENNMVQTVGSAGEALAAGLIFTVPALFILAGDYPIANLAPSGWAGYLQVVAFGLLGGLLGVFMMIPLRRYLIVKQHEVLPYPEGTACAEVLKSGQKGGTGGGLVFAGLLVGGLHTFLGKIMGGWEERVVVPLKTTINQTVVNLRSELSMDAVATLLGVGFIMGLRVSAIMVAGGLLTWLGIIPLISYFGEFIDQPLGAAARPIADMTPDEVWANYIRYIGAGAIVFGGIISLIRAFPTVTAAVWRGVMQSLRRQPDSDEPTERDLPMWVVLLGAVLIVVAVWLLNYRSGIGWIGAVAVAVCGFILVAVASRVVGYIGAMSSPVAGMTIAALLGAGLLFAALGIAGPAAMAALIGVGAVVCIAIAIAGDCSQDLKTGHLVGATPASQQAGEVIGIITCAFTCAAVLFMLNNAYGFVPDDPAVVAQTGGEARETLLAPQANVIAMVLKGVLDTGLPWELVIVGMALALVAECLGIASLPFAIGLYLPLYVTTPIFAGGLLRWLAIGRRKNGKAGHGGVLAASGLVAGGALVEVVLAGFKSSELLSERVGWSKVAPESWLPRLAEWDALAFLRRVMEWRDAAAWHGAVTTLIPFVVLMLFLGLIAWISARRARDRDEGQTPFPSPFPPVTPAGPITPDRPPETPGLGPSPFDEPTAPPEPEGEPPSEQGRTPDEPESPPTPDTSADRFAIPPISPQTGPLASQPDTIPLEEDESKADSSSEESPEPETIDRIGAPSPGFAPTDSEEQDTSESSGEADDTEKRDESLHGGQPDEPPRDRPESGPGALL